MTDPELVILSRDRAERYVPERREICISITDPGAPEAALSPAFVAVLRMKFHDIGAPGGPADVHFTPEHAATILEFVGRWPDAERIVVHCTAGASRSPAVALGLSDLRGWPTSHIERMKPFWNSLVRDVMAAMREA